MKGILRPDGFTTSLLVLGAALLFVPMMVMPGLVAIASALAYWIIMILVRLVHRRSV